MLLTSLHRRPEWDRHPRFHIRPETTAGIILAVDSALRTALCISRARRLASLATVGLKYRAGTVDCEDPAHAGIGSVSRLGTNGSKSCFVTRCEFPAITFTYSDKNSAASTFLIYIQQIAPRLVDLTEYQAPFI